jgi:hypothetical protein
MIKITVTPPKQEPYSTEFTTVSDAIDYLLTLHTYGYAGAKEAAQQMRRADSLKRGRVARRRDRKSKVSKPA